MLGIRELATVRAALAYWRDEMCPHGIEAMRAYFDHPDTDPLTASEVAELQGSLSLVALRFVLLDEHHRDMVQSPIFCTFDAACAQQTSGQLVASLFLSLDERISRSD